MKQISVVCGSSEGLGLFGRSDGFISIPVMTIDVGQLINMPIGSSPLFKNGTAELRETENNNNNKNIKKMAV